MWLYYTHAEKNPVNLNIYNYIKKQAIKEKIIIR